MKCNGYRQRFPAVIGSTTIMIRLILFAGILTIFTSMLGAYLLAPPARLASASGQRMVPEATIAPETWPICSSMGSLGESADWAALDPDFAAGKRAIVAGDWNGAIKVLTAAGLRDDRNADIQNYLGYAYRRLRQLDDAMQHYQQALKLNPRHRSAHEHLGEAYLMRGDLTKARERLAALERICLIPCQEYDDLKRAMAAYVKLARD